jgi:hypothetical protein
MTGYFLDGSNLFGVTMVLTYQISDTVLGKMKQWPVSSNARSSVAM